METRTVYIAAGWDESLWIYPGAQKGHKLVTLHVTLGAQFGTKFCAVTALTTLSNPDTSKHSLQCDMFEPDPKHRGEMQCTELAPECI